ncbi:MAG: D-alanyl-D-alanine carboxypeptidase family protein [Actinobacteria bacterium]|nr:D-alanyl-D-alanine carboxypeptidase family protein [Actinomycetota bacterium]
MRRRSMIAIVITLITCLGLIAPQAAQSAPTNDPRAEREKVRAEKAQVAAQIDTSKASIAEIDDALQALAENLQTQEAALAKAEADVAQAEKDIADAEAAIEKLGGEISILRKEMSDRAIREFVNPASEDLLTVLDTEDMNAAANRSFYIELRSQDDADIADRLEGATVDLAAQKEKAAEARERAVTQRAEQTRRTESVRQAKADQQTLYTSAEASMQAQIARSVELAKTDAALSKQIAEQQAQLAARLAAERARKAEAARAAQAAAAAQAAQAAQATQPTQSQPSTPTGNQNPDGSESTALPPVTGGGSGSVGGISLCTVGGITVNCAIQSSLTALLNAARADGLVLTGGGWRDSSAQIALRRAHCGSSYYAIYQMPASQCRPPTAPPGSSQHEIGLAIDFSNCSSRSTRCYQWLAANAARFGFRNLPSEPWHWSTTGN